MDELMLKIKEKAYTNYLSTLSIPDMIEEMLVCNRHYKQESYDDEFYFKQTVCRKVILDAIDSLEDSVDGG